MDIVSYKVDLILSFFDYILDFIYSDSYTDICLNCGAKVLKGSNICEYCHSYIQETSQKMKLTVKRII